MLLNFASKLLLISLVALVRVKCVSGIIRGSDVRVKKSFAPFIVQVRELGYFMCGGTILSDRFVLTAAHCVRVYVEPSIYTVAVGSSYLNDQKAYEVRKITIHPEWDEEVHFNNHDLAILELKKQLKFSESVKPLPIYPIPLKGNENVAVFGWGLQSFGRSGSDVPKQLQGLKMRVVNFGECRNVYSRYKGHTVIDNHLCLWNGKNSKSGTCTGDSGGPVVYKNRLVGSLSAAYRNCSTEKPNLAIRLAPYYLDWIKSVVGPKTFKIAG